MGKFEFHARVQKQNGTFEPVNEIQIFFFGQNTFLKHYEDNI